MTIKIENENYTLDETSLTGPYELGTNKDYSLTVARDSKGEKHYITINKEGQGSLVRGLWD